MEAESVMIKKEATELKYKDFAIALYLMGMHGNKAKEQACLLNNPFALANSASVGCACMCAETNLDNYMSVIYDIRSLKIWRNDIAHEITKRTPRHGLETDFGQWK